MMFNTQILPSYLGVKTPQNKPSLGRGIPCFAWYQVVPFERSREVTRVFLRGGRR